MGSPGPLEAVRELSPHAQRIARSGLDRRPLAPVYASCGVLFDEVRPGHCVAGAPSRPDGASETLGPLLVLADAALGVAVSSALPDGLGVTTLSFRVSSRGRTPVSGWTTATAELDLLDAHTGLSSGVVRDGSGAEIARIGCRCAVLADRPSADGTASTGGGSQPVEQRIDPGRLATAGSLVGAIEVEHHGPHGVIVRSRAASFLENNAGLVQGGALAAVVERATALVLGRPGRRVVSRDLDVQFLRAVPADGTILRCRASIVHAGRRFAVARADLYDADGRPALAATSSVYALT